MGKLLKDNSVFSRKDGQPCQYAVNIWDDKGNEIISREEASKFVNELMFAVEEIPSDAPEGVYEGWELACQTISMRLRYGIK